MPQSREKSRLERAGATAVREGDGSLTVRGAEETAIGELAASLSVTLHLLAPQTASLEEAFMELTEDSIEYHGMPAMSSAASTGGGA